MYSKDAVSYTHLVSEIVSAMTDDEEVICAAVLHDTIEDCRGITKDVLKLRFGDRVCTVYRLLSPLRLRYQ